MARVDIPRHKLKPEQYPMLAQLMLDCARAVEISPKFISLHLLEGAEVRVYVDVDKPEQYSVTIGVGNTIYEVFEDENEVRIARRVRDDTSN